ncbi:histidine kinase [Alkalimonas collagenimarina]|uniref:Histidine kinase n=1 Tax=Alkalimonas collagenimarina TaxID=400390 RepID=A0ABT9H1B0_9GAMM|nr:histidine kinase [Alkalimonas collagenimarina]MDP4536859.1 histidine kinase [Alkalimonas collagenimarina]
MTQTGSLQHHSALPAFCQSRGVLAVVVLAQAVAIILAFSPGSEGDPWLRLGVISLFVHWTSLLSIAVLCRLRLRLALYRPWVQGLAALLTLLFFTLVVSLIAVPFLAGFHWQPAQSLWQFTLTNLLIAFIVGLLAIQFSAMHLERSLRIEAQSRAELDALQARIRPHFLFNSLNTAAELTHQDPAAAEQALLNLASLFRAAMHAGEQAQLQDEIALAKQYLALEQWRLGERLQVHWRLPKELVALTMPVLTLQPLLENAIYHGIEPAKKGGILDIELVQSARSVTLLISNTLPEQAVRSSKGNGIALENIRQRLALMYQQHAQLHCSRVEQQFRVKLVLPRTVEGQIA